MRLFSRFLLRSVVFEEQFVVSFQTRCFCSGSGQNQQPREVRFEKWQRRVWNDDGSVKDYFAVLGLEKSATETQVRLAYHDIHRELHPDFRPASRNPKSSHVKRRAQSDLSESEARARLGEAHEAYYVLRTEHRRIWYLAEWKSAQMRHSRALDTDQATTEAMDTGSEGHYGAEFMRSESGAQLRSVMKEKHTKAFFDKRMDAEREFQRGESQGVVENRKNTLDYAKWKERQQRRRASLALRTSTEGMAAVSEGASLRKQMREEYSQQNQNQTEAQNNAKLRLRSDETGMNQLSSTSVSMAEESATCSGQLRMQMNPRMSPMSSVPLSVSVSSGGFTQTTAKLRTAKNRNNSKETLVDLRPKPLEGRSSKWRGSIRTDESVASGSESDLSWWEHYSEQKQYRDGALRIPRLETTRAKVRDTNCETDGGGMVYTYSSAAKGDKERTTRSGGIYGRWKSSDELRRHYQKSRSIRPPQFMIGQFAESCEQRADGGGRQLKRMCLGTKPENRAADFSARNESSNHNIVKHIVLFHIAVVFGGCLGFSSLK